MVPAHTPETKQAVETILYPLWDVGLKVGQSVRTVAEAADYARNDPARCFYCKDELFTALEELRRTRGFERVANDYFELARTVGLQAVAADVPGWLSELTARGSGDDVTLAFLSRV